MRGSYKIVLLPRCRWDKITDDPSRTLTLGGALCSEVLATAVAVNLLCKRVHTALCMLCACCTQIQLFRAPNQNTPSACDGPSETAELQETAHTQWNNNSASGRGAQNTWSMGQKIQQWSFWTTVQLLRCRETGSAWNSVQCLPILLEMRHRRPSLWVVCPQGCCTLQVSTAACHTCTHLLPVHDSVGHSWLMMCGPARYPGRYPSICRTVPDPNCCIPRLHQTSGVRPPSSLCCSPGQGLIRVP